MIILWQCGIRPLDVSSRSEYFIPIIMDEVRILIVADDPLARAGLATLLADQPGCTVVGQLNSDVDLLAASDVYCPDVVVWDLGWDPLLARRQGSEQDLPETNLERLAGLKDAGLSTVALLPDETHADEVWAAGAYALLPRDVKAEQLLATVLAVDQGLMIFDPTLIPAPLSARDTQQHLPPIEELTPRELEVLQLLAEGLPNKAIARRLNISEHTVKFHVNAILGKLSAQSRTEAVVRATRLGLILL